MYLVRKQILKQFGSSIRIFFNFCFYILFFFFIFLFPLLSSFRHLFVLFILLYLSICSSSRISSSFYLIPPLLSYYPLFHSHLSTSLLSSFLPSFPLSVITEILSSQKIVENHDDARGRFRNAKEIGRKTKMAGRMSG